MTTWWKSARFNLLVALVALPLHASLFSGHLRGEHIQVTIAPSPSATVFGATLRLPLPTGVLRQSLPLRLLTGTRRGNHVELQEWDAPDHQTASIQAVVRRQRRGQHWYETALTGRWKSDGRTTPFTFSLDEQNTPGLGDGETATFTLDERLHTDLRASRWRDLEFDARLICGVEQGAFCDWIEAAPILEAGGNPPETRAYLNRAGIPPWHPHVLERAGSIDAAAAEARSMCQGSSPIGCFFYADLASRLPPVDRKQALLLACSHALVACKQGWGEKEIALVEAARRGDEEEVRKLIAAGVNVNVGGGMLLSAVQAAALARSDAIVEQLMSRGASPDSPTGESGYLSPLFYAIDEGDEQMAVFLIDHGAAFRHVPRDNGLMLAAALNGERLVVHKMLSLGMPPDEDTAPVGSSLTAAVKNRDHAMIEDLLAHGANPNYDNNHSGGSPIDWARRLDDRTALELLLGSVKSPN